MMYRHETAIHHFILELQKTSFKQKKKKKKKIDEKLIWKLTSLEICMKIT